ncbi:hypothetical protein PPTG_12572 [Phytophthora nicotianae INRA-310]|uniref:Uncharacterized protein n=1 Tax=Phytophthora nicotianae (strain INRA-310) TaxID=761204 RepID=W2Q736_PHYN3|nr:hypothetical protein PPTG_12572 [Phytophthora nicotianae INRA-310]ETN08070.1 hypothetical protein PPTG_12572 [Phytophthora nicotianae INRA-310]
MSKLLKLLISFLEVSVLMTSANPLAALMTMRVRWYRLVLLSYLQPLAYSMKRTYFSTLGLVLATCLRR